MPSTRPRSHVYGSMLVLIAGTVLAASAPSAEADWGGVLLCLGSVLCAAAWTVVSALLLQRGAERLDSVSLVFVSSPTCIATLALLAALFESASLGAYLNGDGGDGGGGGAGGGGSGGGPAVTAGGGSGSSTAAEVLTVGGGGGSGSGLGSVIDDGEGHAALLPHAVRMLAEVATGGAGGGGKRSSSGVALAPPPGGAAAHGLAYVLTGGLLGFSYDLIHNQFLRMTSSVTMSVMGNTKLVVLIALSMATLERPPSAGALLGVALALCGVLWYTIHRHLEARQQERAAAHEKEASGLRAVGAGVGLEGAQPAAAGPRAAGEHTALLGSGAKPSPSSSTC